jgi:hypothetical protein
MEKSKWQIHGHTKNLLRTPEYQSWKGMKARCNCKTSTHYKYYGGKGISVCNRWINSFQNFLIDMGQRPKDKTLDRIDNSKGYSKRNCRWATRAEQSRNQSKNFKITICCQTKTLKEWCRDFDMPYTTCVKYFKAGKSIQDIIKNHYIKGLRHPHSFAENIHATDLED